MSTPIKTVAALLVLCALLLRRSPFGGEGQLSEPPVVKPTENVPTLTDAQGSAVASRKEPSIAENPEDKDPPAVAAQSPGLILHFVADDGTPMGRAVIEASSGPHEAVEAAIAPIEG
jgi:hypothetical protein